MQGEDMITFARFTPPLAGLLFLPGEPIIPFEIRQIQAKYPGWEIYDLGTPNSQIPKKFRYSYFQKLEITLSSDNSQLEFDYVLGTYLNGFNGIDIETICLDKTGNRLATGGIGDKTDVWGDYPMLSPDGKPLMLEGKHTLSLAPHAPPKYVVLKDFSRAGESLYYPTTAFDRVVGTIRRAFLPYSP